MSENNLKKYYSAKELLGFSLSCLPNTVQGIIYQAKKNLWETRKRVGQGGGVEYALNSLPAEVQTEIYSRFALAKTEQNNTSLSVVRANLDVRTLTSDKIAIADARMALVAYVTELERNKTRRDAVQQVVDMAGAGTLPEHLSRLVAVANAKAGKKRTISYRTLMGWVCAYHKCQNMTERLQMLTPLALGAKELNYADIPWLPDMLYLWQSPNRPSLSECVKRCRNFTVHSLPSDSAIRRAFAKLPLLVRERGRATGSAYKQFLPYTTRDWEALDVNEVWVGDGHGFKAKVKHPLSGRPFKPEITAIMDGKCRYVTGWSVHMSENCLAVADAIRHGIEQCGMFNIYYSDNGGGESNKRLDADLTGIFPRLGISHQTGIPGNAQGRGIIERLWRTAIVPLARTYASFDGARMDNETKRIRYKALAAAENALNKGNELTPVHQKALRTLPEFKDFLADLEAAINEYNNTPHSQLPRVNGEHLSPAQYREILTKQKAIEFLSDIEREILFRPEEVRTVSRGLVELFNNKYFSLALADYHGEKVRVCYDLHNAQTVVVKTMTGSLICTAEWDGNKRAAFAQAVRDQAAEKALQAAIKRKQSQIDAKVALHTPVVTIEHQINPTLKTVDLTPKQEPAGRIIFTSQAEKDDYLAQQKQKKVG